MKRLSLATAVGSMRLISKGLPYLATSVLGITEDDVSIVTSDEPWLTSDRPVVRKTLDAFIYGTIEALGLARFQLPSEYIAAVISTFVSPCNYFPACTWVTGGVSNEELANGVRGVAPQGFEESTPQKLFALVLELEAHADITAAKYAAKTGTVIGRLQTVPGETLADLEG